MHLIRAVLLLLAVVPAAGAQEVSVALGRLHAIGGEESTYSWQMQYFHSFSATWSASIGWLNEGHIPDHHRDGALVQAWRFHRMEKNALRVGVGLGAYRFFDTTREAGGEGFKNKHGVLPMLSITARYPGPGGGWAAFVQLNRTLDSSEVQTQAVLLGAAFNFGPASASGSPLVAEPGVDGNSSLDHSHELTFYFGRTILNSFESESSEAFDAISLEYRQRLTKFVDISMTYCDEGDIDSVKRDGLTPQIWLTTRSFRGWLLGFGVGPYFNRVFPEQERESSHSTVNVRTSLRYSMLAGRHLGGHWGARLQWNRTLTSYHRDTDLLQVGLAYQW